MITVKLKYKANHIKYAQFDLRKPPVFFTVIFTFFKTVYECQANNVDYCPLT